MSWAEANDVDFIFGLAQNSRLRGLIQVELDTVTLEAGKTGKPVRMFRELRYGTLDSCLMEPGTSCRRQGLNPARPDSRSALN